LNELLFKGCTLCDWGLVTNTVVNPLANKNDPIKIQSSIHPLKISVISSSKV